MVAAIEPFVWGAGGKKATPESIARQRKVAEAMLATGRDFSPVESWTQGAARVANALVGVYKERKADRGEDEGLKTRADADRSLAQMISGSTPASSVPGSVSSAETPATTPASTQSVNSTLPPEARALLDTIAGTESPDYQTIYGGKKFDSFADHPRIAVPIASGPNAGKTSSAAGRYQFLGSTWDAQKNKLGLKDFSPESQDLAAWDLAQTTYQQKTGRDLAADLKSGDPNAVAQAGQALNAVWTSLPSGIEAGTNANKFASAYAKNFSRYGAPQEQPAPVQIASADPNFMPNMGAPATSPGVQAVSQAMQAAGAAPQAAPQLSAGAQKVAQAMSASPSPASPQTAPAPSPANSSADIQQLLQIGSNPWASDSQKQVVNALLGEKLKRADPLEAQMRQLQIQKLQKDVNDTGEKWAKLDDGTLFNPKTGETKRVAGGDGVPAPLFEGKSVEAQSLNGLVASGAITKDQAFQLGAGKTITGPNNELIFMTPQGVFGQNPGGQVRPLTPPATPASPQNGGAAPNGMIALTQPKANEGERKAMTFADRMAQANEVIDKLGMAGTGLGDTVAASIPLVGNALVSEDYQKVDQAKRNFVNAVLRRESGAVISPEEFANADKQYFPQRGDSDAVLKQKAQNRQTVMEGMKRDAGPTYRGPEGGPKKIASDDEYDALPSGAIFVGPDGVERRKP